MSDEFGFFLLLMSNGVLIGLMYSLIALGFVLVYKATDAINFAQGEFVMIAGFVAAGALMVLGRAAVAGGPASALAGHDRASASPSSGSCCASSSAGPVIAVVMATIGLASILRGVGPFTIFAGHQAAAAAHPRRALHAGAALHPAHPAAGRAW